MAYTFLLPKVAKLAPNVGCADVPALTSRTTDAANVADALSAETTRSLARSSSRSVAARRFFGLASRDGLGADGPHWGPDGLAPLHDPGLRARELERVQRDARLRSLELRVPQLGAHSATAPRPSAAADGASAPRRRPRSRETPRRRARAARSRRGGTSGRARRARRERSRNAAHVLARERRAACRSGRRQKVADPRGEKRQARGVVVVDTGPEIGRRPRGAVHALRRLASLRTARPRRVGPPRGARADEGAFMAE